MAKHSKTFGEFIAQKDRLYKLLNEWVRRTRNDEQITPEMVGARFCKLGDICQYYATEIYCVYFSTILTKSNKEIFFDRKAWDTDKTRKPFYITDSGRKVFLKPTAQVRYFKDNYFTPCENWIPFPTK